MHIIGHIDMDAFFASVEERDSSRLAGRPIVVGADPENGKGRGVVSTANYAARAYGIHSALPISTAWKLSEAARKRGLPPAVFLEVNMRKYSEISEQIMAIVREHVPPDSLGVVLVEQASVDEAYFDLSRAGSYENAECIARAIKEDIKTKKRLTASVGIGPNKLIAKIASGWQKPDGLTVIREENAEVFLEPLSIRTIPGVGPKSEEQFARRGIRTVREAKRLTKAELITMMGKAGEELYEKLRGRGDSQIVVDHVQKSIGEQITFEEDIPVGGKLKERKLLEASLAKLAANIHRRLRQEIAGGAPFKTFRSIGITVRFSDFTTKTRIVTLKEPIAASAESAEKTIQFQALRLFMPLMDRRENPSHKAIRLLGVKVERFK